MEAHLEKRALECLEFCAGHADLTQVEVAMLGTGDSLRTAVSALAFAAKQRDEYKKELATLREQIAAREAELAEARKNVVRYEYLKSDMNTGWICAMRRESKEWDEEIDAAIARQEGEAS